LILRIVAVSAAVGILVAIVYFPTYSRLKKMRRENTRINSEIEDLREEIAEYEHVLKELKENPGAFEKIARENLGVIKDNEIIVDIQE